MVNVLKRNKLTTLDFETPFKPLQFNYVSIREEGSYRFYEKYNQKARISLIYDMVGNFYVLKSTPKGKNTKQRIIYEGFIYSIGHATILFDGLGIL